MLSGSPSVSDQRQEWTTSRQHIEIILSGLTDENRDNTYDALCSMNIIKFRGILCRTLIQTALRDPGSSPRLSALVSLVHSEYPEVSELLLCRLVCVFKKAYCRNKLKLVVHAIKFICELMKCDVVDEILVLQILDVLIKTTTQDDIRLIHQIILSVGEFFKDSSADAVDMVFDRLRVLLQEGDLRTTSQKHILTCLQVRRDAFGRKSKPCIAGETSKIEQAIIIDMSQKLDPQTHLSFFHVDSLSNSYRNKNEKPISVPISPRQEELISPKPAEDVVVIDKTDNELIKKQKLVYLSIMSSMSPDEAVHKLLRLSQTEKIENAILIDMVVKCCAQEKTYSKYFGVVAEKICRLSQLLSRAFVSQFQELYDTIHQYEGAQLRNMGKLFGHLIAIDTLPFRGTLGYILLTETDTSSAGRVFIKFLFQEMVEELGIEELESLLRDSNVKEDLRGLFPVTNVSSSDASQLMFSINYFTAIGLGSLTREMRTILDTLPSESRGRKRTRGTNYDDSSASRSESGSYSRSSSPSRAKGVTTNRPSSRSQSFSRSRSPAR